MLKTFLIFFDLRVGLELASTIKFRIIIAFFLFIGEVVPECHDVRKRLLKQLVADVLSSFLIKFKSNQARWNRLNQFVLFLDDIFSSIFLELSEGLTIVKDVFELILESLVWTKERWVKNWFDTSIADDLLWNSFFIVFVKFFHYLFNELFKVLSLRLRKAHLASSHLFILQFEK